MNEVDVLYHPDGFPNDITGEASCSVGVVPPVALPVALPPTGGLAALAQDSSALILLALIGFTLIGGSAWIILGNRRWEDRHGSRF
ncbi:MAG: hypothetical protein IH920_04945 [Chloroflexi bacterium]|nr:hypothetical protein [Chloroflexota bacterium]